ncbi:SDR family NAD(P)-dependent oxidoreductase [uncultured Alistipes sp.]|uniref:SDR family NAD(P)-dependent oxidoreductase n=1 Tax=uncultured Alistipes sp. TaxID=538949 RepID=UPI00262979E9|nr:SDR family NAD(P)-dependent oxidoreductase [uncultured Alistipes sp.]
MDRRGRVVSGRAWALVTGAGTGIGRSFALRLAAAGYDLVLVGQTAATLARVRDEIAAADISARRQVRILTMDLARTEASDELYATVREMGIDVDVLVNNAGIFSFRDILQTPPERIERMILLHDMTLSKNCLAFGRDMAARGRGWILNMSSYSIWMPFPGMALYTATKAYVRTFSVAFAKEMAERGVRVTAVCPAGVATDLYGLTPRWQRIGLRLGVLISADSCARRGLRALWRGRRTVVPDWWNRAFIPLCKLLPMWLIRPLRRFTMQFQK